MRQGDGDSKKPAAFPLIWPWPEGRQEELACEAENLTKKIRARFPHHPVKVIAIPKRTSKIKGEQAALPVAPFTKIEEFNPTSRKPDHLGLQGDSEWPGHGLS